MGDSANISELEEQINLQWGALLEKNCFPEETPGYDEPVLRDIAQLEHLANFAGHISRYISLIPVHRSPTGKPSPQLGIQEDFACAAIGKIVDLGGKIRKHYLSEPIPDSIYDLLTKNTADSLYEVAAAIDALDSRVKDVNQRVSTAIGDRKRTKFKMARGKIEKYFLIGAGNDVESVQVAIQKNRERYVALREQHDNDLTTLETLAESTFKEDKDLVRSLAKVNVPTIYHRLKNGFEDMSGVLESEAEAFEKRFKEVTTFVKESLPAIKTRAFTYLHKRIPEVEKSLDSLCEWDEGFKIQDDEAWELVILVDTLTSSLSGAEYFNATRSKGDKRSNDTEARNLLRAVKKIQTQVRFVREHKTSYETLSKYLDVEDLLLDTEELSRAQRAFVVFSSPRWQKLRERTEGIYPAIRKLEDDFLAKLENELFKTATYLRESDLETFSKPECLKEWKLVVGSLQSASPNDAKQHLLYALSQTDGFKELNRALRTPELLNDSLHELYDIGRRNPLSSEGDELVSWYKSAQADLEACIGALPENLRENKTILKTAKRQRDALKAVLTQKVLTIPEARKLRVKSDEKLEDELTFYRSLTTVTTHVSDEARKHFQRIISAYETEQYRREQWPAKVGRVVKRLVWGDAPRRVFIPDTNVVRADPEFLEHLTENPDNGVALLSYVFMELDQTKSNPNDPQGAFECRRAMRKISEHTGLISDSSITGSIDESVIEEDYLFPKGLKGRFFEVLDELKRAFRGSKKEKDNPHTLVNQIKTGLVKYRNTARHIGTVYSFDPDASLMEAAAKMGKKGMAFGQQFAALMHNQYRSWRDVHIMLGGKRLKNALRPRFRFWAKPEVVFLSMDNLALHRAVPTGIRVERYRHGSVMTNPALLYTGFRNVKLPDSLWADIHEQGLSYKVLSNMWELANDKKYASVPRQELPSRFTPNEFVIAKHPDDPLKTVVTRFTRGALYPMTFVPPEAQVFPLLYFAENDIHSVGAWNPYDGLQIAASEMLINPEILSVTLVGESGTGKSLLAAGAAARHMYDLNSPYKSVHFTRPYVPTGETMGYVPGDEIEKAFSQSLQFFSHLRVALESLDPEFKIRELKKIIGQHKGFSIDLVTMENIRGRDIHRTYRVLDEAQNTTVDIARAWLTRHAGYSKSIITGDIKQSDLVKKYRNGLLHYRQKLPGEPHHAHLTFQKGRRGPVAAAANR